MSSKSKNDIKLLLLLTLGIFSQVSLIFPSGTVINGDLFFWGAHYHDGLWHVALIQKLSRLSFENPVFAGESIGNYHYLFNLFLGLISRISGVSILSLTYKIFPICISFLTGLLTYIFAYKLFKNKRSALWSVFYIYLGSTFAYFLPLFGLGYEVWEMSLWVQQPISTFFNLPFSASLPILLLALIYFQKYLQSHLIKDAVITSVLFGIIPVIKSFSVIFLLGLGVTGLIRLFLKRKTDLLLISLGAGVIFFILISPTLRLGDNHLIFEPGWFLQSMMEVPDRVGWQDWGLRLQHYNSMNAYHQVARLYLIAFIIFVIGNLGTRIIAIYPLIKSRSVFSSEIHQLLIISGFGFFLIPLFFLTNGVAWNAIQFFYYFLFIAGTYAGWGTVLILEQFKNRKLQAFISLIFILLTVPVNIQTFLFYNSNPPGFKIEKKEFEILKNLRRKGNFDERVLTIPLRESFIYVPAITGKSTVLGDELMAIVPGHNYSERLIDLQAGINSKEGFIDMVNRYQIDWLYIKDEQQFNFEKSEIVDKHYDIGKLRVYKVQR